MKDPKTTRPLWIAQLPARVFPRGPRALYCYLCAFKSGTCFLFNYRLAQKFHVSTRTIIRWRSWLIKHQLAHTWYLDPKHPRLNCHHYKSFRAWVAAMAMPPKLHKIKGTRLTEKEKQARIRKFKAQILGFSKMPKLSP